MEFKVYSKRLFRKSIYSLSFLAVLTTSFWLIIAEMAAYQNENKFQLILLCFATANFLFFIFAISSSIRYCGRTRLTITKDSIEYISNKHKYEIKNENLEYIRIFYYKRVSYIGFYSRQYINRFYSGFSDAPFLEIHSRYSGVDAEEHFLFMEYRKEALDYIKSLYPVIIVDEYKLYKKGEEYAV